ncbi:redox-sensitive transcriptional activator SoxR [Kitasatospora sp. NPDC001574]
MHARSRSRFGTLVVQENLKSRTRYAQHRRKLPVIPATRAASAAPATPAASASPAAPTAPAAGTTRRPGDLLSVGEVARRAGVAPSAVRFYEDQGLIASERSAGNQRRYHRHVLRRLSLILVAKRLGIPLAEVAEVFEGLPADRMPDKRDWERISRRWAALLTARRREIERLEQELTGCIGCGCLSLRRCRVLNPQDSLGTDGPGPRRLLDDEFDPDDPDDPGDPDGPDGPAFGPAASGDPCGASLPDDADGPDGSADPVGPEGAGTGPDER